MTTLIIFFSTFFAFLVIAGITLYRKSAFFTYHLRRANVMVVRNIAYKEGSTNPKQRLDLYLPRNIKNFPMVYFVHGGYWQSGDKNYWQNITGLYGNIGVALARQGIGVAVANYRLYPEVSIDEQISDVTEGALWLQNHASEYGGRGKIFFMGHSAGGNLVMLLATKNKFPTAGSIALSAVWDINDMVKNADRDFNEKTSFPVFGVDEKSRIQYSPGAYLERVSGKVFIAVGGKDYPYLKKQAELADRELISHNVVHEYMVVPEYIHTDMSTKFGSYGDILLPRVVQFIQFHS